VDLDASVSSSDVDSSSDLDSSPDLDSSSDLDSLSDLDSSSFSEMSCFRISLKIPCRFVEPSMNAHRLCTTPKKFRMTVFLEPGSCTRGGGILVQKLVCKMFLYKNNFSSVENIWGGGAPPPGPHGPDATR